MTSYAIEIQDANLVSDYEPLTARSHNGAVRQMKTWLAANPIADDSLIFLSFARSEDGQRGYINPWGADVTGQSWR